MKPGMKRRLLIGIPVAVLVLLTVTFFVLRSYFNEARLLALLQPRLEEALGRPVSVDGARLRAWPLSVSLQGLSISDTSSPPEAHATLVHLGELQCRVDPGPLLRRRLLIQSLVLDSLRVHLRQAPDATWNVAQPPSATPTPKSTAAPSTGTPLALTIRTLQIRNAWIEIDQSTPRQGVHLPLDADLEFESDRDLRRVVLRGDLRCSDLQGQGALEKIQGLRIRLQPQMTIDVPDSSARIDALTLQVQELEMALSGALHLQQAQVFGTVRTESNALDLDRVMSLIPPGMAPGLEGFEARGKVDVDLEATLRGRETPLVEGTLQVRDGRVNTPELPQPLEDLQADLRWQGDRIDITQVTCRFGNDPLQATGVVHDPLDAAATRFDVQVKGTLSLPALATLATLPPGTSLDGNLVLDCRAAGRTEDPDSMSLTGTLAVRDAHVTSPQTRQPVGIHADARLTGNALRIDEARLTLGNSTAQLHGQASPLRPGVVPRLRLEGRSAQLDLDAILPEPTRSATATGATPAGATAARPTRSLLPPHPPGAVEVQLDVDRATYQLARWSGVHVTLNAGPHGFDVSARVDSMQRDALRLDAMSLTLQGDSLQAHGAVDAERSRLGRVRARGLHSRIDVRGTQVSLPDLAAAVYGGRLTGRSTLELADPRAPRYELSLDMDAVQAGALLADVLPGGEWMSGTLQGSSSWSSSGAEPAALRSNLTASGQALSLNGTVHRFPLVDALTQNLHMNEVPTLAYNDLGMSFSVQQGLVNIPRLQFAGPELTAASTGSVALDGKVDLGLNVVLSEEATRRYLRGDVGRAVTQLFTDPQGRLVLDFKVGGTLTAPKLQADLQSTAARSGLRKVAGQELQRMFDDLLQKKDAQVGETLRRGLGNLLGGKDRPPAAADSTRKR